MTASGAMQPAADTAAYGQKMVEHAIVTGGSRGIGKAIARELAREGADVAIVARSKADLEATARELAAETNRRIVPLAADVTSKEQVDRMVAKAAQQLGGLHILV